MNVYEKLQEARQKLLETASTKSGQNTYSKYTYFQLDDFIPAIISIFKELKLFSHFDFDENTAILNIINSEKSDEIISFAMPVKLAEMKGSQAIQQLGATATYLRRYLYITALDICEADQVEKSMNKPKETKKTVIKDPIERLFVTAYEAGYSEPTVRESCKLRLKKEVEQLTPQELETLTKNYEKMVVPK